MGSCKDTIILMESAIKFPKLSSKRGTIFLINCQVVNNLVIAKMSYFTPGLKPGEHELYFLPNQPAVKIQVDPEFCNNYPTVITQCQSYPLLSIA